MVTRQGIFLSKADNGTCQSCFVRIRPQVFQEIKLASKVHTCDSCRRFLYHEPTLKPALERPGAEIRSWLLSPEAQLDPFGEPRLHRRQRRAWWTDSSN